jgi:hypothetical protein
MAEAARRCEDPCVRTALNSIVKVSLSWLYVALLTPV